MIWRDSVKRNGLRFPSLYSTTLLDVMGEDCAVLFYWQRKVVLLNGKLTGLWEPELLLVGRGSNTYFMQKYDNHFLKCI